MLNNMRDPLIGRRVIIVKGKHADKRGEIVKVYERFMFRDYRRAVRVRFFEAGSESFTFAFLDEVNVK